MVTKKSLLLLTFFLLSSKAVFCNQDATLSSCGNECREEMCDDEREDLVAQEFLRAIETNDVEALRSLLDTYPDYLEKEIYQTMTPLVAAIICLSQGIDSRDVVRLLLSYGADTSRVVFTQEDRSYNVVDTSYNLLDNVRKTQDYLVQLEGRVQEVIQILES
jgi:hypothetical protein